MKELTDDLVGNKFEAKLHASELNRSVVDNFIIEHPDINKNEMLEAFKKLKNLYRPQESSKK